MIVSSKNRFLKVFLISIAFFIFGTAGVLWATLSVYSLTNGVNSEVSPGLPFVIYLFGLLLVIAELLYIYSHYLLAKAKGYSAWFTLLGLINTFGIVILFLLPDRHKTS